MSWFNAKPPSNRPKKTKATKAQNKQAIKGIHKAAAKIPGMNTEVSPGRAANRYKDIMFHSRVTELKKKAEKKPGGHLMWDKKPGDVAFPRKGKKK